MNKLNIDKQVMVLNALVEGNSIRSTERMFGVHRDTFMRLTVRITPCMEDGVTDRQWSIADLVETTSAAN